VRVRESGNLVMVMISCVHLDEAFSDQLPKWQHRDASGRRDLDCFATGAVYNAKILT
jgi:hypothetical protein